MLREAVILPSGSIRGRVGKGCSGAASAAVGRSCPGPAPPARRGLNGTQMTTAEVLLSLPRCFPLTFGEECKLVSSIGVLHRRGLCGGLLRLRFHVFIREDGDRSRPRVFGVYWHVPGHGPHPEVWGHHRLWDVDQGLCPRKPVAARWGGWCHRGYGDNRTGTM